MLLSAGVIRELPRPVAVDAEQQRLMAPINNISFPQQQKPGRTGETEGLENARAERHSRTQESVRGQDRASISAEARQVSELRTELSGLPDIRQDRVEALRRAIQEGSFQVSDKQIADALLSDWLPGGQKGE